MIVEKSERVVVLLVSWRFPLARVLCRNPRIDHFGSKENNKISQFPTISFSPASKFATTRIDFLRHPERQNVTAG